MTGLRGASWVYRTGGMRNVAVIGAGSWGTALASMVHSSAAVVLWARREELARAINERRENSDYLAGYALPDSLLATHELEEALANADVVVLAVPSFGLRGVLEQAAGFIPSGVPILSVAKGLEPGSMLRMTEVVSSVLGLKQHSPLGVLTGPNLVQEIIAGQPAASVVAMSDEASAIAIQRLFMSETFRVYTNPDVIGCELAGVLKNVVAIAVGIAEGMGYGENTKATLITRGLSEITRLGVAMKGDPLTFLGLAGIGDLVATCAAPTSRNRSVGVELGRGRRIEEIMTKMKMVAEGVGSTPAVLELASRCGVEMPIAERVGAILRGECTPAELVPALMLRQAKSELEGLR